MPSNRSLKPEQEQDRRVQLSIRLPRWLVDWLKKQDNQGEVIEEALIKTFSLERKKG